MITIKELIHNYGGYFSLGRWYFVKYWHVHAQNGDVIALVEKSKHTPTVQEVIKSLHYVRLEVNENNEILKVHSTLDDENKKS